MTNPANELVERGRHGDRRVVGLVCAAHFFSHFYILALPPLFPILKTELGLSYIELGGLFTAFSVASGVAQYPMGVLVDRIGARVVLISGLALLAGAIAMMSLADGYAPLLGFAFLAGLGNSVFHPADYTILGASVRPERWGRAFGIHTFSGYAGWAAAPPLVAYLAGLWSWQTALLVLGSAGLVMAAILAANFHVLQEERVGGQHDQDPSRRGVVGDLKTVLAPAIVLMFLFNVVATSTTVGMPSFTPAALSALFDTPLVSASAVLTAFMAGSAGGVLVGGFVADRVRRLDLVALVGFAAAAAAICLVATVAMPFPALLAVFAFAGFMIGVIMPSRDLMIRSITPPGASGKIFGFVSIGLDVGGALAPLLFGWILDQGAPRAMFFIGAGFMLVSLLIAVAASNVGRRRVLAGAAE